LSSGSYWDAKIEIDILTITNDEKIYVGECKWTNHKVNKKEFHKLNEKCQKLDILPSQIILFSKRGFSKELMSMQGKELALYSCEEFRALLKESSKERLIENLITI
jgi:aspartate/tyrosine/aromatic aminotransferase